MGILQLTTCSIKEVGKTIMEPGTGRRRKKKELFLPGNGGRKRIAIESLKSPGVVWKSVSPSLCASLTVESQVCNLSPDFPSKDSNTDLKERISGEQGASIKQFYSRIDKQKRRSMC